MIEILLAEPRARLRRSRRNPPEALCARIVAECHPQQRDFVLDPAPELALLTPRGAGKTIGLLVRFIRRMLLEPRSACFYFATTRLQAERLLWEPLKQLCARFGLEASFNETKRVCRLPNGSSLVLCSADKVADLDQYRGTSYSEVGIDEAAAYKRRLLRFLLDEIIGARCVGALTLASTPGRVLRGLFYDVTRPGSTIARPYTKRHAPEYAGWTGWSLHSWTTEEAANHIPEIAKIYRAQLALIDRRGWSVDHPVRRRELGGEWAADDTENVYAYQPHKDGKPWNQWDPARDDLGIAVLSPGEWLWVVGLDLGHADHMAIIGLAWQPDRRRIHHIFEWYKRKQKIRDIATFLLGSERDPAAPQGIIGRLGWPVGAVADASHLGGMILAELQDYGLMIEAAKKKDKVDATELLNGDLIDGELVVLKGSELENQLGSLQWEENARGQVQEAAGQPNHCTDALIYARRKVVELRGDLQDATVDPELSYEDRLEAEMDRLESAMEANAETEDLWM